MPDDDNNNIVIIIKCSYFIKYGDIKKKLNIVAYIFILRTCIWKIYVLNLNFYIFNDLVQL